MEIFDRDEVSSISNNLYHFKLSNLGKRMDSKLIDKIIGSFNFKVEVGENETKSKIIQHYENDNIDKLRMYEYEDVVKTFTLSAWSSSNSLEDIQTLMMMFILGYLTSTPEHFGPLDPESNIISDELYNINRLGFITHDSQPYDRFPGLMGDDIGKMLTQTPYIMGFIPKIYTDAFVNLILKKTSKLNLSVYDMDNRTFSEYFNVSDDIYNSNTNSYTESYDTQRSPPQDYFDHTPIDEFMGINNKTLIRTLTNHIYIATSELSNQVFSDIIDVLKQMQ